MIARRGCGGPRVLAAVAGAAVFAAATPVQGQRGDPAAQPTQLPREFVDLLVARSGYRPAHPAYRLGAAPESLPGASVFTVEGRIVGSVLWRDRTATGIVVPVPVRAVRARFETLASEAGWAPKPEPEPQRGFVPALSADPTRGFCWPDDDGQLSIRVYPAAGDSSYVILHHTLPGGGLICAAPPEHGMRTRGLQALMPTLRPPDGIEIMGGGGSSSDDQVETHAATFGRVAPAELVAHFEPQLRDQGWTVEDRLAGERSGVLSATKPGEDHEKLLLSVLVHRLSDEEQSLSMTVTLRR